MRKAVCLHPPHGPRSKITKITAVASLFSTISSFSQTILIYFLFNRKKNELKMIFFFCSWFTLRPMHYIVFPAVVVDIINLILQCFTTIRSINRFRVHWSFIWKWHRQLWCWSFLNLNKLFQTNKKLHR